ncbi:MAG: ATP-binding protein [Coprococcus phoceensis]
MNGLNREKNLVITGKTSSGKSYLANALCICALRQFKTVRYMKASQLINELPKAEKLDTYQEELNLFAGYDLLVVDDFGLMNMDVNKCRNLFEVFDSRDPHKSILVIFSSLYLPGMTCFRIILMQRRALHACLVEPIVWR